MGCHSRDASMYQSGERALSVRSERYALLGQSPPAGRAKDAFARKDHTHGPPDLPGRCDRQDMMVPKCLVAKPSANEG